MADKGEGRVIVAGFLKVSVAGRQAFVDAHTELVRRARAIPGCIDLAISADPLDANRVNMIEVWRSEAELEAWRKVASPPNTGIAIEGGHVEKHYVDRSVPPF